jgi:galactokinase
MIKLQYIKEIFNDKIGHPDIIIQVPGRANIIGEHIDYCGAAVLPFAIEQSMYFIAKKRSDSVIHISALDMEESFCFSLEDDLNLSGWQSYVYNVIKIIGADYNLSGADIFFNSEIPIGAGVSSSSALCVGMIYIIDQMLRLNLPKNLMVDIASQAEHGMGIRGGIMDQYTILYGQKDKALLIDCHNQSHTFVDLSAIKQHWILFNTNVKHNLVDTPYNDRRSQVEEALHLINKRTNSKKQFTDVTESDIALLDDNPLLQKRLRHICTEIQRVEKAKQSIENNDIITLGQLLNDSHRSLSNDYEVSCEELDFICKVLIKNEKVLGCRMMGGGFGGSVIALVEENFNPEHILYKYKRQFNLIADMFEVRSCDGVKVL